MGGKECAQDEWKDYLFIYLLFYTISVYNVQIMVCICVHYGVLISAHSMCAYWFLQMGIAHQRTLSLST